MFALIYTRLNVCLGLHKVNERLKEDLWNVCNWLQVYLSGKCVTKCDKWHFEYDEFLLLKMLGISLETNKPRLSNILNMFFYFTWYFDPIEMFWRKCVPWIRTKFSDEINQIDKKKIKNEMIHLFFLSFFGTIIKWRQYRYCC